MRVGMDTTAISKGILEVKHKVGEGFKDLGKEMLAGLSLAGMVATIEKAFQRVSEIQNTAARSGIGVEELQRLDYAAEQLHIPIEKANIAFDKLNIKIGEAKNGIGTLAEGFERWGIAIKGKNNEEIIASIADKMKSMPDPADRAAMAFDVMGKGGATLIPLLERGSAAMKQMSAHASIFTKEDIEALESAHQSIAAISNTLMAWTVKVAVTWPSELAGWFGRVESAYEAAFKNPLHFVAAFNKVWHAPKSEEPGKARENKNGSDETGDSTSEPTRSGGEPASSSGGGHLGDMVAAREKIKRQLTTTDARNKNRIMGLATGLNQINDQIALQTAGSVPARLAEEYRQTQRDMRKEQSHLYQSPADRAAQTDKLNDFTDRLAGLRAEIVEASKPAIDRMVEHQSTANEKLQNIETALSKTGIKINTD